MQPLTNTILRHRLRLCDSAAFSCYVCDVAGPDYDLFCRRPGLGIFRNPRKLFRTWDFCTKGYCRCTEHCARQIPTLSPTVTSLLLFVGVELRAPKAGAPITTSAVAKISQ